MDSQVRKIPDLDRKHRVKGIESKKSLYGRMFILPWCIGMAFFFIIPLVQSLIYSFSTVMVDPGEMSTTWLVNEDGKLDLLGHYRYILTEDPTYTDNLMSAVTTFFRSLPSTLTMLRVGLG